MHWDGIYWNILEYTTNCQVQCFATKYWISFFSSPLSTSAEQANIMNIDINIDMKRTIMTNTFAVMIRMMAIVIRNNLALIFPDLLLRAVAKLQRQIF